jgi:hypothetical protein
MFQAWPRTLSAAASRRTPPGAQLLGRGELQRGLFSPSSSAVASLVGDLLGGGAGVDLLLHQRRQHPAGADGVAGDAGGGVLQRGDLGQAHDAVLGRHVGRFCRRGHQAVHRGHVDDAAPVARLHARQRQPRGVEGRAEVDGDDGVPALGGKVLDGHVLDAGVVDQDVHAAELGGAKASWPRSRPACSCRRRGSGLARPAPATCALGHRRRRSR